MESKQIFGIVIACLAVCILIGILSAVRKDTPPSPQDETRPAVSNTAIQMPTTTTDFWDALASQQAATQTTETTAIPDTPQTDENGEPILSTDITDGTGMPSDLTGEADTTDITPDVQSAPDSTATTTTNRNVREDGYHIILTN